MAKQGFRSTAEPTTKEYALHGGKVLFSYLDSNDKMLGMFDMGNCPEVTLTVDAETYEHFSVREGKQTQDMSAVIQQSSSVAWTVENGVFENLQLFFAGKNEAFTNPTVAGFADAVMVVPGNLKVNAWYQVVDANGKPCFGISTTNAITVDTTNGTPLELVVDVDYKVDALGGMVFIMDTTDTQAAVTAGEGITTTLAADVSGISVDNLAILAEDQIKVAVRIEQVDAVTGEVRYLDMHKVGVSSNGDLPMISPTEVAPIPLTGELEKNSNYEYVANYYAPSQA